MNETHLTAEISREALLAAATEAEADFKADLDAARERYIEERMAELIHKLPWGKRLRTREEAEVGWHADHRWPLCMAGYHRKHRWLRAGEIKDFCEQIGVATVRVSEGDIRLLGLYLKGATLAKPAVDAPTVPQPDEDE